MTSRLTLPGLSNIKDPAARQAIIDLASAINQVLALEGRQPVPAPGFASSALPKIGDDLINTMIIVTDTDKLAYLKAGTPNVWTYLDGSGAV